jgi:hypothetical protein
MFSYFGHHDRGTMWTLVQTSLRTWVWYLWIRFIEYFSKTWLIGIRSVGTRPLGSEAFDFFWPIILDSGPLSECDHYLFVPLDSMGMELRLRTLIKTFKFLKRFKQLNICLSIDGLLFETRNTKLFNWLQWIAIDLKFLMKSWNEF